jgi:ketosteroid isomerase-like protein
VIGRAITHEAKGPTGGAGAPFASHLGRPSPRDTDGAMSQENVEVIMRAFEAARDDPEEFFGILDENIEWDMSGYALPGFADTYYGRDGVREFFRTWIGAFADWGYEADEVIDAGNSVVVQVHQWGRGKGSGIRVEHRFCQVWTLWNRKVVRLQAFPQKDLALEAAGLSE